MGRIKSQMVKRTAKQVITEGIFCESFDKNKKVLKNTMPSKPIRNKIAGYLARLTKMSRVQKEKDERASKIKPVEQEVQSK